MYIFMYNNIFNSNQSTKYYYNKYAIYNKHYTFFKS